MTLTSSILCLAVAFALVAAALIPQEFEAPLDPANVIADEGYGYKYALYPKPLGWPFLVYEDDDDASLDSSILRIYENGRVLGPAHALHADIRELGEGRYSFYDRIIYFSLPDNRDPRTAGTSLVIKCESQLSNLGLVAVAVFGSSGVLLLLASAVSRETFGGILAAADRVPEPLLIGAVFVVISGILVGTLWWRWEANKSMAFAVGSRYQLSDAAGYWSSSLEILEHIRSGADEPSGTVLWAQRRILYPAFLAGLMLLTGGNILAVLVLQALLAAAALALFFYGVKWLLGWLGSLCATAFLIVYALDHLIGMTVTENLGLVLGTLGFCILLAYAKTAQIGHLLCGAALISCGLSSRPGALFLLPLLVLWIVWIRHSEGFRVATLHLLCTVAAFAVGVGLQMGIVRATGGTGEGSYGSFAYTLYGLVSGG